MMQAQDVMVDGSTYLVSLSKITGLKIADIQGIITNPFDVGATFQLCHVVLDDGTKIDVEGEHDFPYLVPDHESLEYDNLAPLLDE